METHDNIIGEFISAANNIVEVYNRSRVPKYFRDKKLNDSRDKLNNQLNNLFSNGTSVPVKIITDYARILSDEYKPFGSYLDCRRSIKVGPSAAVCIFEFEMEDSKKAVVSFDPANENGSICTINYSYISNGKPLLSFTDSNINFIYDYESYNVESEIPDKIKSATARCIINNITEYLKSIIYKEV